MADLNRWLMQRSWRAQEAKANKSLQVALQEMQQIQIVQPLPTAHRAVQMIAQGSATTSNAVEAAQKLAAYESKQGQGIVDTQLLRQLDEAVQSARACAAQANDTVRGTQDAQDQNMLAVYASQSVQAMQAALAWAAQAVTQAQAIQTRADQQRRQIQTVERQRQRYLEQYGGVDPDEIFSAVKAGKYLSVPAGINLHKGEIALYSTPATLAEDKTIRQRVGGSVGYSIPMGHGFRFRVSSYKGHTISKEQLTEIDRGELTVTTQRIVFNGARRTVAISSSKVLNTVLFRHAVDVRAENRQKREVFMCANPRLLNTFVLLSCQLAN